VSVTDLLPLRKARSDDNSERKRITIPQADESAHNWWALQKDPGLSMRLLIRSEIERTGYVDIAFKPVEQLTRRGRPAGSAEPDASLDAAGEGTPSFTQPSAAAANTAARPPISADEYSSIDNLMDH